MKSLYCYFIFIFIVDCSIFGQDPNFPIIEEAYILYDDYDTGTIFAVIYRNQYTYNKNGMVTNFRSLGYDKDVKEWKVRHNEYSYYNNKDQVVRQEIDRYNGITFDIYLHQEVLLEYENGFLSKRIYDNLNYIDGSKSKKTEYYDDHGRNYLTIREELDGTGQPTRAISENIWDENGCIISRSNRRERLTPKGHLVETEIQYYSEITYISDCLPTSYIFYRINPATRKIEIEDRSVTEYAFDSMGNIVEQKHFANEVQWDTTLTLREHITNNYDSEGNKLNSVITHQASNHKNRRYEDFDLNGNQISEYGEKYDFETERWISTFLTLSTFNSKNNVIKREFFNEFDYLENDYLKENKIDYFYNDHDQLALIYLKVIDSRGEDVITTDYESEYHYDCDQRFLEEIYKNVTENRVTSRRYKIYLDKPNCELSASADLSFRLFPNPAKDYVHISLESTIREPEILITDAQGRTMSIAYHSYNNVYSADMSKLSPGIYLVSVISDSKITSTKLIKI